MPLTTFAELQTSVANWLHRSDLTSVIPDFIRLGEVRLFRDVRARCMETALSGTISSGVLAVPSDYLELKFAYIDASPAKSLVSAPASQIYEKYPTRTASGKPGFIAREGSNFIFGPYPDSGYSVKGIYYARPTSIATTANSLFTLNPDLYLYAALCEAAPYLVDDARVQMWEMKRKALTEQVNSEADQEYGSGGGLSVVTA